jgi:hypothetical protein
LGWKSADIDAGSGVTYRALLLLLLLSDDGSSLGLLGRLDLGTLGSG